MPIQAVSTSSLFALQARTTLPAMKRLDGIFGKIQGWILSLFGTSLRIYDEQNRKHFYLRTRDIVSNLCATPHAATGQIIPSKKITHLVLETLNPQTGKTITLEKISQLFHAFRTSECIQQLMNAKNSEQASAIAADHLEQLKNRHLTIIPFNESAIASRLKPGDIFFQKIPDNGKSIVVTGQRFFAPFLRNKERQGHTFSHVGIYIGNGKIAEAVPAKHGSDVRIISILHPEFALAPSSKAEYLITRFKEENLALSAAVIAAWIAKDDIHSDPDFTPIKYNKMEAACSIFHPSNFGFFGRYRYLKQYIDDHERDIPADIFGLKTFFCSYFVGYCYQIAESRTLVPSMLGKYNVSRTSTCCKRPFFRELWARVRRLQFWNKMSEKIAFQFDSKRMTPHELRNFILRKPDLFQDLYLIQAPVL